MDVEMWEINKNCYSIAFVKNATMAAQTMTPCMAKKLLTIVEQVKRGEIVFSDWVNIGKFIKKL